MTILNYLEMKALVDANCSTNGNQENTGAGLNELYTSFIDSTRTYFVGIVGGASSFGVTGTPTKIATFDANIGLANQLMTPDFANNRITFNEPGSYEVLADVSGEWGNSNDLYIQGWLDGAPVPFFGARWANGEGSGNPVSVAWRATVEVTSVPAQLELYTAGNSSFSVTQLSIALGIGYLPWTIRNP